MMKRKNTSLFIEQYLLRKAIELVSSLSCHAINIVACTIIFSMNVSAAIVDANYNCAEHESVFTTHNEFHYSSLAKAVNPLEKKKDSLLFKHAHGLSIVSLRRTAADTMLDLRFKILDIEKSAKVLNRKTQVYLIDQKSGQKHRIPVTTKLGPLRQTTLKVDTNKIYFMLFANPGRTIKQCNRVSFMFADSIIENIVVE